MKNYLKKSFAILWIIIYLSVTGCSRQVEAPAAKDHASPEAIAKSLNTVQAEDSLYLFEYDPTLPLDIQEDQSSSQSGLTQIDFTYASPKGGRVPARLVLPDGRGPFPGLLLQHGGGGSYDDLTQLAHILAGYGTVVLLINDPYSRPGGWQPTQYMGGTWPFYTEQDLQFKIQYVIDLRRAIDFLLARPDVDPRRLAYWGNSYGGAMGGLLAGVEDRLIAYVLQIGDGGLVEHTSEPAEDGLPDHFAEEWTALMWPTESLHFIRRAAPAAVLFQNGIHDTNVPPSDAHRYQAAAKQPKTVIWYDSDHSLPLQAHLDAAVWLQPYLGEDLRWFAPNYHQSAPIFDRLYSIWVLSVIASLAFFHLDAHRSGSLVIKERVAWTLAIILLGPIGTGIYWLTLRHLKMGIAESKILPTWAISLTAATIITTNLVTSIVIGSLITNMIYIADFRVTLILIYSIMLVSCWLLNLLFRRLYRISTFGLVVNANIAMAITLLLAILTNSQDLPGRINPAIWWVASFEALIILLTTYPVHMLLINKHPAFWGGEMDSIHVPAARSKYLWFKQTSLIVLSLLGLLVSIILFVWSQVDLDIAQVIALLAGKNL